MQKGLAANQKSSLSQPSTFLSPSPSSLRRLRMSTTIPPNFNYATAVGIHSLPGAIVLTVLYALLLVFFSFKSFTQPTHAHFALTFFCVSKYIKKAFFQQSSLQNSIWLIALSTSPWVYFTLRFSRFGKCRRETWIGYCRANPF